MTFQVRDLLLLRSRVLSDREGHHPARAGTFQPGGFQVPRAFWAASTPMCSVRRSVRGAQPASQHRRGRPLGSESGRSPCFACELRQGSKNRRAQFEDAVSQVSGHRFAFRYLRALFSRLTKSVSRIISLLLQSRDESVRGRFVATVTLSRAHSGISLRSNRPLHGRFMRVLPA